MTYFLLQSAALFLAAYFLGCWCGCIIRSLSARDYADERLSPVEATARPVAARTAPQPEPRPAPGPALQPVPPAAAPRPAAPPPPAPPAQVQAPPPVQRPAPVAPAPAVAAAAAVAATAAAASAVRPAAAVPVTEDLKRIKGIGPELEFRLNQAGIRRYAEIAAWTPPDVARINALIGQDGRVQHENWIEQAQILARGEETAFSRRMDRREVTGGTSATWTPTAPQEVAKAAAAPATVRAPEPIRAAPPPPPAPPPAPVVAVSPVVATAAAAATAAIATAAATAKPAISMRPAPAAGNARRFVRLAAPEGRADDISLISGVGDKVAGELNRYGIYHFWQVSAMGPDDIDYLEQRLALRGRIRREEWQEQARELMAGRPPRGAMDRARLAQAEAKVAAPAAAPVQAPVQAAPATPAVQAAMVAAPAVVAAAAAVVAPKPVTPPPPTVQPVLPPLAARPPVQATPAPAPVAIPTQVPPPPVVAKPVQVAPAPAAAPAAAPVAPGPRRFTRLAAPEGKPDDLSLISGVGPDLSAKLNRYGIHHYWIAAMVPEDVDYLEQRLNMRGRVKRDEWQEQSRELMAGRQPRGAMDRARMIQAEAQARMAEARTPAGAPGHRRLLPSYPRLRPNLLRLRLCLQPPPQPRPWSRPARGPPAATRSCPSRRQSATRARAHKPGRGGHRNRRRIRGCRCHRRVA